MALSKVTYVDGVTVIEAQNLNDIQDEIIQNASDISGKQATLSFDATPTNGSSNPVTSDGIYDALATKQNTLTFDDTPTNGSSNPVKSGGVYSEISQLSSALTTIATVESGVNLYYGNDVVGFVQNDGSIATNGSWANYSTGEITLPAGTYTIYGYTSQYNLSGSRFGIAVLNGATVESYVNEYPADNKKTITITGERTIIISATSDVLKMVVNGDSVISPYQEYEPVVELDDNLAKRINNDSLFFNFEIGNIGFSISGPTFADDYRRVRTKTPIDLISGDIIGLTDYSDAEFLVMWQNTLGGYGYETLWSSSEYIARFSGKYWIIIRRKTEVRQTKVSTLANLFFVRRNPHKSGCDIKKTTLINGVNHRGYSVNKYFPENTLVAFKASKLYGFDYVEADVQFTSDDVPVLLHDATINRTARNTDGTTITSDIDIGTITYAQALTYDFGVYAQPAYAGTKIPTFYEFIKLCKDIDLFPYIELKDNNGVVYSDALIQGLVDTVKDYGLIKNVCWTSYNSHYLDVIKEYAPDATLSIITNTITQTIITTAESLKTNSNTVRILSGSYTSEEISLCKNASIELGVFTINTLDTMLALPSYITSVISDLFNTSEVLYNNSIALQEV